MILRYAGLRISECLALQWKDFDFKKTTLAIRAKPEIDFAPKSHAE